MARMFRNFSESERRRGRFGNAVPKAWLEESEKEQKTQDRNGNDRYNLKARKPHVHTCSGTPSLGNPCRLPPDLMVRMTGLEPAQG